MTLVELMLATTVLLMVVGALGGLARTAQQGFEYSEGYGTAAQHARIVLDRISQDVRQATANSLFPGCIVVSETVGSYRYPDTLVVWSGGTATDAASRLPRYDELTIYCPNPATPNQLVKMTTTDASTVPAVDNETAWQTALASLKKDAAVKTVVLTDLLRVCSTEAGATRGDVRFEMRLRPSAADWASYASGSTTWSELPWVQGVYGAGTGLRQTWVRTELQLTPGVEWAANDADAAQPMPYFGSATLYYPLSHL